MRGLPEALMVRVISQFHHVVALLIAEHLECVFKREGSGSAKAGADDFECHVVSLRCVRSNSFVWVELHHKKRERSINRDAEAAYAAQNQWGSKIGTLFCGLRGIEWRPLVLPRLIIISWAFRTNIA